MATVGYFNLDDGKGAAYQQDLIQGLGETALKITDLGDLGASQVLYIDNPDDTGYSAAFQAHQADILNFASAGGVVVMNDRFADGSFVAGFSHDATGQYSNTVDFINDTGVVADGAGGTLTDFSLDFKDASNHGVADIAALEDSEVFAITTAFDPTKLVTMGEVTGQGLVIYSTIPTDYFLDGHPDPDMSAFAENLLQYAVGLQAMAEVDTSGKYIGSDAGEDVFGSADADILKPQAGDDFVHAGDGADKVNAGAGDDIAWGGDGIDVLKGASGNDQLWGGADHDKMNGGTGNDYLSGGSGSDLLRDLDGDNTLIGGSGDDRIQGGDGYDKISGGEGGDYMIGGGGADIFFFGTGDAPNAGTPDEIADFVHGQDQIDLTGYGHDFTVSLSSSFSGVANEMLLYEGLENSMFVAFDFDGDANMDAFFEIHSPSAQDMADITDFVFFHG